MLQRLIHLPFYGRMLTLAVSYKTCLIPIGGSDFHGEQHLGAELVGVRVLEVNCEKLDFRRRGHYEASEFFLWEAHANEIALRVIEKHLRGGE